MNALSKARAFRARKACDPTTLVGSAATVSKLQLALLYYAILFFAILFYSLAFDHPNDHLNEHLNDLNPFFKPQFYFGIYGQISFTQRIFQSSSNNKQG